MPHIAWLLQQHCIHSRVMLCWLWSRRWWSVSWTIAAQCFRTAWHTVAICAERRRPTGVLCKKSRTHNATPPWTTLAESSRENSVPVVRSGIPLSSGHSAVISWRDTTAGLRRAFSVAAPQTWNSLPADIRSCVTLQTFKRHLKTHLFPHS